VIREKAMERYEVEWNNGDSKIERTICSAEVEYRSQIQTAVGIEGVSRKLNLENCSRRLISAGFVTEPARGLQPAYAAAFASQRQVGGGDFSNLPGGEGGALDDSAKLMWENVGHLACYTGVNKEARQEQMESVFLSLDVKGTPVVQEEDRGCYVIEDELPFVPPRKLTQLGRVLLKEGWYPKAVYGDLVDIQKPDECQIAASRGEWLCPWGKPSSWLRDVDLGVPQEKHAMMPLFLEHDRKLKILEGLPNRSSLDQRFLEVDRMIRKTSEELFEMKRITDRWDRLERSVQESVQGYLQESRSSQKGTADRLWVVERSNAAASILMLIILIYLLFRGLTWVFRRGHAAYLRRQENKRRSFPGEISLRTI
jgi:hypothetical protein